MHLLILLNSVLISFEFLGESLSDEEKDKEEDEKEGDKDKDEEDDDDGFFVGHGVLDKDELKAAEEEFDEEAFDEELEIKKQKLKAQKFEEEYKKKKPSKVICFS